MKKRGVVTFVFDDGYKHIFDDVVPVLNSHHMAGVFGVPLNTASEHLDKNRKYIAHKEWLAIRNRGHEIAAHSVNHIDLTTCTSEALQQELREPRQTLEASTIIYPGGGHNDQVVSEAKQSGYTAGRTVLHGLETLPPKDPMRLKTYNFTRDNFSVWKANLLALWAYLTNAWLIETYHIVEDDYSEDVHTVSLSSFTQHARFVARLGVPVHTIQDVCDPKIL